MGCLMRRGTAAIPGQQKTHLSVKRACQCLGRCRREAKASSISFQVCTGAEAIGESAGRARRSRQQAGFRAMSEALEANSAEQHRKENNGHMANGGSHEPRRERSSGAPKRAPRQERPGPRPDRKGPASDMDQLKDAVGNATVGTGEVQKVIRESTFQPRAAAFTSLIQQCARVRAWQKALEVFQALQEMPGLKPNLINYSALISACSTAGRWQEAEKAFTDMVAASESDDECSPNTITFSSLIAACERGGRLDRALHWYHQMEERGVEADHIIYSSLITSCERNGKLDQALELVDSMHAAGLYHSPDLYAKLIEALGRQQQWEKALELFLSMQLAGAEAGKPACMALLSALEAGRQPRQAMQLLDALAQDSSPAQLDGDFLVGALRVCAKSGAWQSAMRVWQRMQGTPQQQQVPPQQRGAAAQLVIQACRAGKNASKAAELTAQFRRSGLMPSSESS